IILLGAAMLTAAFRGFGGEDLVKHFLTNMPGGFWSQFLIVMFVIFLLGFFIDFIEIAVVVVPIVSPILLMDPGANITAVWLGVMIGLNIQTSFLTPPFGFALFYLRGVAPPSVTTLQIYKGVVPFILIQLLALAVVGYMPSLVNYWPTRLNLLSEVAPPPANPRLQYCIEQLVLPQYKTREAEIRGAIAKAKGLDYSYLPQELRNDMTASFAKAEQVFTLVKAIDTAEAAIEKKKPAYAPLHREVRDIQQDIIRIDAHRRDLEQDAARMQRNGRDVSKIQAAIAAEDERRKTLAASVPTTWAGEHKAFGELLAADTSARQRYRRTADEAYQPLEKLLQNIDQTADLERAVPSVKALSEVIQKQKPNEAVDQIDAVNKIVGALGGRTIRSELSRARSAMRSRTPDPKKAEEHVQATLKLIDAELTWRKRAVSQIKPQLDAYNKAILTTIGLREQPKLPRTEALSVASCMANHRDVSLHF
ncbi:MAG: TRAP transporter large permease subunit, partial [Microbacteriaceae bacterium]|nr:TRAP transporter large permease subunit [Microbacteriaceae bacterium]